MCSLRRTARNIVITSYSIHYTKLYETSSINKLLLATDFSDWARRAEEYACTLSASWRTHLTVMTVLEFPPGLNPDYPVNERYLSDRTKEATEQLAEFKQRASKKSYNFV